MDIITVGVIIAAAAGYLLYIGYKSFRGTKEGCSTNCGCTTREKLK